MPAKPPKEYQFKKGQSGNPEGARRHSPVRRTFKKLTEEELRGIMEMLLKTNPNKLGEAVSKSDTVLKAWIGQAAIKGMNNGELGPLMTILERILGKPKNILEITNRDITESMTDEELAAELARVRAANANG